MLLYNFSNCNTVPKAPVETCSFWIAFFYILNAKLFLWRFATWMGHVSITYQPTVDRNRVLTHPMPQKHVYLIISAISHSQKIMSFQVIDYLFPTWWATQDRCSFIEELPRSFHLTVDGGKVGQCRAYTRDGHFCTVVNPCFAVAGMLSTDGHAESKTLWLVSFVLYSLSFSWVKLSKLLGYLMKFLFI